jgi:hypothetical protein
MDEVKSRPGTPRNPPGAVASGGRWDPVIGTSYRAIIPRRSTDLTPDSPKRQDDRERDRPRKSSVPSSYT